MSKPLGYWVSVTESHKDYHTLEVIKSTYGVYLENLTQEELSTLLIYCVGGAFLYRFLSDNEIEMCNLFSTLDESTRFRFTPFLYELISHYPVYFIDERHKEWYQVLTNHTNLRKSLCYRASAILYRDENGIERSPEDNLFMHEVSLSNSNSNPN